MGIPGFSLYRPKTSRGFRRAVGVVSLVFVVSALGGAVSCYLDPMDALSSSLHAAFFAALGFTLALALWRYDRNPEKAVRLVERVFHAFFVAIISVVAYIHFVAFRVPLFKLESAFFMAGAGIAIGIWVIQARRMIAEERARISERRANSEGSSHQTQPSSTAPGKPG